MPTAVNNVTTVAACQAQAVAGGFNTFAVQSGSQCFVGNASPFNMYGPATGCATLGGTLTNQVYQLVAAGSTGAGFVVPTVSDPLSYAVSNTQTAQYAAYIGDRTGGQNLQFWNPADTDARIPVSGYQLLFTWPVPVVVSTFSCAFESATNDSVHGCKTVTLFTNTIAAGGTQIQAFPVPNPTAYATQTFTLTTPVTTTQIMVEFTPAGGAQCIISNCTWA